MSLPTSPILDKATLNPLVRKATGRERATVLHLSVKVLSGGYGEASQGIFRVNGEAQDDNGDFTWSLILKILAPTGGELASATLEPTGWNYWKREAFVYLSDLHNDLPLGLAMPRCYGCEERPDGTAWLWLETVESLGSAGSVATSAQVARLLGRFNGAYLAGKPLPGYPWLAQRWMRNWLADAGPSIDLLRRSQEHPMAQLAFPAADCAYIFQAWEKHQRYLAVLESLPQTLCHMDVFARNILPRLGASGEVEHILVDWVFCGPGAVGEELVSLVMANLFFAETPYEQADDLEIQVMESYLTGLEEAGWLGDPRLAQLGFAIGAALRYDVGAIRLILPFLLTEGLELDAPSGFGNLTLRQLIALVHRVRQEVSIRLDRTAEALIQALEL